jgi:hypothetical protein
MKIIICGSVKFLDKMKSLKKELAKLGFSNVVTPCKYENTDLVNESETNSRDNKIKNDLIKVYYNEIKNADAVLIANYNKNGIDNYIGGNSFLEAAFAHVLNKKLYFLFEIPKIAYSDELKALRPIILNGDLNKIK